MPLYKCQCSKCGEKFETRLVLGDDPSKIKCPKCGATNPKQLQSVADSANAPEPARKSTPMDAPMRG